MGIDAKGRSRRRARRGAFALAVVLAVTLGAATWRGALGYFDDGVPAAARLHVVANSDSAADQQVKLNVRDALRPVVERLLAAAPVPGADLVLDVSASGAGAQYLDLLRETAAAELRRLGSDYAVTVVTETGDLGELVAIRIIIGKGKGANWFCVLVPPLCFADLEPIEKVTPRPGNESAAGGIRIAWKWLGKWFGRSSIPLEGVGNVDQDDVHADLADATPRDSDVRPATK